MLSVVRQQRAEVADTSGYGRSHVGFLPQIRPWCWPWSCPGVEPATETVVMGSTSGTAQSPMKRTNT
jgi:hypothetical protein